MRGAVSIYNARKLDEILNTCCLAGIPDPDLIFFLSDGSQICMPKRLDDTFNKIREWFVSRSE